MKKIMLTAAAVATLSSSTALASMEDMFYVKVNGGWNKLSKVEKMKSENSYFGGLGVGYYVMDNVRADLTFDHYFEPKHKATKTVAGDKITSTLKGKIDSLMLNGYVDLVDVSVAKVFVGAGVGMSQVSGKLITVDTDPNPLTNISDSDNIKKKTNFSYALHVGASTEFAPGVNGELFYSYKDFGKTKKSEEIKALSYKGHHVGVGIRFDI
jgi:opacity protein-like surface antigen